MTTLDFLVIMFLLALLTVLINDLNRRLANLEKQIKEIMRWMGPNQE